MTQEEQAELNEQLFQAAKDGKNEEVRELIKNGAKTDESFDQYGNRAIHFAARNDNLDLVKTLIIAKADVNAKNKGGQTPLHKAALYGYTTIAEELIAKGADVNIETSHGNITALHEAAARGHTVIAAALIAKRADVNAKDRYGLTPLHYAALYGYTTIAEELIAKVADVNAKDVDGQTPLHLAARNGNTDTAKELLEAEAKPNTKDNHGQTPLHLAALRGNTDTAKELLEAEAKPNTKDNHGQTPLHLAARNGNTDTAKELLAQGAQVNTEDNNRKTPLDIAKTQSDEFYNIVIDAIAKQINHTSIKGMKAFTMGTLVRKRNQSPVNILGGEEGLFQKILGKVVSLKLSDIPEKEGHREAVEKKLNELQREHAGPHAAQVAAGRGGDLPRGRN